MRLLRGSSRLKSFMGSGGVTVMHFLGAVAGKEVLTVRSGMKERPWVREAGGNG